jgi:hypothetical protein
VQQNKERYRNQVEKNPKLINKLCRHFSMARGRKKSKKILNLMAVLRALSKRRGGMKRMKSAKSMKTRRKQKGGALGAGLALGMLAPMLLGTVGKILKINV